MAMTIFHRFAGKTYCLGAIRVPVINCDPTSNKVQLRVGTTPVWVDADALERPMVRANLRGGGGENGRDL